MLNESRVPSSCLPEGDREDGLIPVNHIASCNERNTQTGLFHRHALQAVDLFSTDAIEDSTYFAFADQGFLSLGVI